MNIINSIKQWVHENTTSSEDRIGFVLVVMFFGTIIFGVIVLLIWLTGGWAIIPIVVILAIMAVLMVWLVPEDQ